MVKDGGPVLLYDGVCRFCNWTVRLLLRVDRRGVFRFAPLQGELAAQVLARHPTLRAVDSLVLVEAAGRDADEAVSVRSDAVLRTLQHVGGAWRLLIVLAVVPRPVRDWAYDLFARHRYRVFGRFAACPVPPPEVRERFLE